MKPVALIVSRFRSFKSEQRFEFPQQPGLYFMSGDNQAEPRLEGNGAGKSSLLSEALTWCLFGKTSRGLQAGSVANWDDGKGCRVEFVFEHGGDRMSIERVWSPNSWLLRDAEGGVISDLTKGGLADLLPLGYESFLHCIVLPQGEPLFLDLRPEPKAALFSEVMQLDNWLEYSRRAADSVRDAEAIIKALTEGRAAYLGQLESLADAALREEQRAWEAEQRHKLTRIADDYERAQTALRYLCLPAAPTDVESARRDHNAACAEAAAAAVQMKAAQRAHDAAAELDAQCPTCRQTVGLDAHVRLRAFTGRSLATAEAAATAARKKADRMQQTFDAAFAAGLAADDAAQRIKAVQRDLDVLDRQAAEVEGQRDPYEQLLADAIAQRRQLEASVRQADRGLVVAHEQLELRAGWVRWFKEIRLEQIGDALTELEVETNSAVNAQGLVDWELHFQTDDLKQSGRMSRGFSVFVKSPHNSKPVPWEAWSGGESQRLRIAAQQGLAELVRSRVGVDLPLEVWDEPTQWLSPQGVIDLLDELKARAHRTQRQVWVVDHRSLGYGGFDGMARVVKTETGSHVETHYME